MKNYTKDYPIGIEERWHEVNVGEWWHPDWWHPRMKEWCSTTLQSSSWHYLRGKFFFRNETDRTMFMLRWS